MSAVIALEGGDDPQAPPAREPLVAEKGAGRSMTQAARDALRRVDAVLSDNAAPLHSTIDNLSTFAEGLARNTPKLDGIVAGLERMTGGGAPAPRKVAYDLHAVDSFGAQRHAKLPEQLVMAEPTAIARLQTQRFLFTPDEEIQGFEGAQWSDSLPVLVQARLLQSFENYRRRACATARRQRRRRCAASADRPAPVRNRAGTSTARDDLVVREDRGSKWSGKGCKAYRGIRGN
ncbi:hypothetical protein ACVWY2_007980 [Bradyrhizobium sp. JR6.1]